MPAWLVWVIVAAALSVVELFTLTIAAGTAAKHELSFFDALVMLTQDQPWIPAAA